MTLKAFETISIDDFPTSRLQQACYKVFDQLTNQPDTPKVLLTNVAIATAGTQVQHGLGYPATGWIVVRASAPAQIYDDAPANNPLPKTALRLRATAPVTVSLLVF